MRAPLRSSMLSVTCVTLALSSCNSFNQTSFYEVHTDPSGSLVAPQIPVALPATEALSPVTPLPAPVTSPTDVSNLSCPFYTMPRFDGVPELPYRELHNAEQSHDAKAVDKVVKDHILDLRLYIRHVTDSLTASYSDYLIACHSAGSIRVNHAEPVAPASDTMVLTPDLPPLVKK
jgi:hypothetical protein